MVKPTYKYTVIKYVPDLARGEAVNIGVILHGVNFADARFTQDLSRVKAMGLPVDEAILRLVERAISKWVKTDSKFDPEIVWREFGRSIQFSQPRVTVAEDPKGELDELFEAFVLVPRERKRRGQTRDHIRRLVESKVLHRPLGGRLEKNFEVTKIIPRYDNFMFDWGVRVAPERGYFLHALSFDTETEDYQLNMAKVFALTCEEVTRAVPRAWFAGVVQPPSNGGKGAFEAAQQIFEERTIGIFSPNRVDDLLDILEREIPSALI